MRGRSTWLVYRDYSLAGLTRSGAGKLLAGLAAEGSVMKHGEGRNTRYHTARRTGAIRDE